MVSCPSRIHFADLISYQALYKLHIALQNLPSSSNLGGIPLKGGNGIFPYIARDFGSSEASDLMFHGSEGWNSLTFQA